MEIDINENELIRGKNFLVWSNEHGAYWGPNNCGYYTDVWSAGRYTLEEGMKCCDTRSQTKECPVPEYLVIAPEFFLKKKIPYKPKSRPAKRIDIEGKPQRRIGHDEFCKGIGAEPILNEKKCH